VSERALYEGVTGPLSIGIVGVTTVLEDSIMLFIVTIQAGSSRVLSVEIFVQ